MSKRSLVMAIGFVGAWTWMVSADQISTTPNGTWALYPAQSAIYQTQVQQPINTDGSSSFNGKRGVIPVKFGLTSALGPVVLPSIYSDADAANDFGYVSFRPSGYLTFQAIASLSAVYAFVQGNCQGGSLRWSVRVDGNGNGLNDGAPTDPAVFIYYGALPNFTDCTGANLQSGTNLINQPDLRYDTAQLAGGTFYDSYAHAIALTGSQAVLNATLVIDSGWVNAPNGDQQVAVTSATITTSSYTDTFVPLSGSSVQTCNLPPAEIQVTKTSGANTGTVNETVSIQPGDNDGLFRVVDCKYMYNLDVQSLRGTGGYSVEALIDGAPVSGAATFNLK